MDKAGNNKVDGNIGSNSIKFTMISSTIIFKKLKKFTKTAYLTSNGSVDAKKIAIDAKKITVDAKKNTVNTKNFKYLTLDAKRAFYQLQHAFTEVLILQYFDLKH